MQSRNSEEQQLVALLVYFFHPQDLFHLTEHQLLCYIISSSLQTFKHYCLQLKTLHAVLQATVSFKLPCAPPAWYAHAANKARL